KGLPWFTCYFFTSISPSFGCETSVKNCDLKILMDELELLSKQIKLQLMCKKENIKKGKK
ncbi:hypothetical protein, partial [Myroides marinus]|uniref:hypothetical protein n=1 Tax=Myroides marinus TaxID=703342 RepID=UPI0025792253